MTDESTTNGNVFDMALYEVHCCWLAGWLVLLLLLLCIHFSMLFHMHAGMHMRSVGRLVGQAFVRRSFGCLTCILSFALFFIAYTYLQGPPACLPIGWMCVACRFVWLMLLMIMLLPACAPQFCQLTTRYLFSTRCVLWII